MSVFLKVLTVFFQALFQMLSFAQSEQLREDGERKVILENLEEAYEQQGVSNEIEERVASDGFTPSELERMHQYERTESQ